MEGRRSFQELAALLSNAVECDTVVSQGVEMRDEVINEKTGEMRNQRDILLRPKARSLRPGCP